MMETQDQNLLIWNAAKSEETLEFVFTQIENPAKWEVVLDVPRKKIDCYWIFPDHLLMLLK